MKDNDGAAFGGTRTNMEKRDIPGHVEPVVMLPCPFCGGKNIELMDDELICSECGAIGPRRMFWYADGTEKDSGDPLMRWNQRKYNAQICGICIRDGLLSVCRRLEALALPHE